MFEDLYASGAGAGDRFPAVATLRASTLALAELPRDVSDAERIEQIRALEELKAAAAGAQARAAADLDASVRAAQAVAGVPDRERGRGLGAQVALARRESPHSGGRHLGLAKALVDEMPCTLAALTAGVISEWRATLLVRETACLTKEQRAAVDAEVAGDLVTVERMGDRALASAARAAAYRLDPHAATARARRAASDRTVTLRPAPDTMTYLTALLPVEHGVACYAALSRAADTARAEGAARGRGQALADTLVERLTGRTAAEPVPIQLGVVMTERALLAGDGEPAHLQGYGVVPAPLARDLLRGGSQVSLRRLFTHPETGELIAAQSRGRVFPRGLRRLLVWRDQTCRTPWCDAPIRHADHVRSAALGGPTSLENGQGLCEACNYAKQAAGWVSSAVTDSAGGVGSGGQLVMTTTPTGHTYASRPPPLPGSRPSSAAEAAADAGPAGSTTTIAPGWSVATHSMSELLGRAA